MRVLGILPKKEEILWVVLEGSDSSGSINKPSGGFRVQLPAGFATEAEQLSEFLKILTTFISQQQIDAVAIVTTPSEASVNRAKVECICQLASVSAQQPTIDVAAITVSKAWNSKFKATTGQAFEDAFGKLPFAYLKEAAVVAWIGICKKMK